MIAFLTLCYVALLAILVWLKVLPNTLWTWLSTIVWMVLLFVLLFIPMQWGAPAGPARVSCTAGGHALPLPTRAVRRPTRIA